MKNVAELFFPGLQLIGHAVGFAHVDEAGADTDDNAVFPDGRRIHLVFADAAVLVNQAVLADTDGVPFQQAPQVVKRPSPVRLRNHVVQIEATPEIVFRISGHAVPRFVDVGDSQVPIHFADHHRKLIEGFFKPTMPVVTIHGGSLWSSLQYCNKLVILHTMMQ